MTRNQLTGLKLVNGAPFTAIKIFPNFSTNTITLTSDVTLHLGPLAAVLLQLGDIANLTIPGLPKGTILIKSKTVTIPKHIHQGIGKSKGKLGFNQVTHKIGPLYERAVVIIIVAISPSASGRGQRPRCRGASALWRS